MTKNVKIQPIELAYKLGASPAFCKLAKYISRQKNDKKINLQKAIHCIRGLISFDYIKEDGSWNISKIAKDTGTSRTTVYKYLKK
jgi:DNA-binding phage protein